MKACPGLRSGIDRSGSLSFAIRGIPSSIRPPIRHSGEGRNPGGVGRGKTTRRWKKPTHRPTFILLFGLRKAMAIPAIKSMPRTPIRGRNPGGVERGCSAGACPQLGPDRPASHRFHPLMRPSQGHGDSRQPSFTRIDEIYQFCRQRRVHGRRPGTSLKLETANPRHCSTSGRLESYVSPNDTRSSTAVIPTSSAPVSSRSLPSPT